MCNMLRWTLLAICIWQAGVAAAEEAKGFYSIVSPGVVYPNSKYNVAVNVEQLTEPCQIKLKLEGPDYKEEQSIELQSKSVKNVQFTVPPQVKSGNFKLHAEGISGLIFSNSTSLKYADNPVYVYVQTDKATYKPTDMIRFRVIFLDEHTRSASIDKPINIFIRDAEKNRLKHYKNVNLTKGVFTDKLQLSDFPVLGDWQIEVQVDGKNLATKHFSVEKYVLPKYEVQIEVPTKVPIEDEKFGFTIRAKYTFGQFVKGTAKIVIKATNHGGFRPPIHGLYPQPHIGWGMEPQGRPPYMGSPFYYPQPRVLHIVDKTVQLNGKAFVDFDMEDVLADGRTGPNHQKLSILVIVEEALTGHKRNVTAETELVPYRYVINTPHTNIDCTGDQKTFNYEVTITDLENQPISDSKYPVKFSSSPYSKDQIVPIETYADKNGVATFVLKCPTEIVYGISYTVAYRGQTSSAGISYSNNWSILSNVLSLKTHQKSVKIGNEVEFTLQNKNMPSHFTFTIVNSGKIVSSGSEDVPQDFKTQYTFKIPATFEMMPKSHLFVHYVEGKDLKFVESTFNVESEFENNISIEAPDLTKPGEKVTITVNTQPDSYVGLLAVDQSVLLLKSGNDFSKESILKNVHQLTSEIPSELIDTIDTYPGRQAGLVTMTNAHFPHRKRPIHRYPEQFMRFGVSDNVFRGAPGPYVTSSSMHSNTLLSGAFAASPPPPPPTPLPRIRKQFLENWFYDDFVSSGKDTLSLKKTVPDTITSWIVTGFSLNPNTGFSLTEEPTKIKTFRPFFISTNLPYSVKRGELVSIPVIIFNYMDQTLNVEITLTNDEEEFEFSEPEKDQTKRTRLLSVTSNNAETATFNIRPKRIGHITLKITAISPLSGDAVHKQLKVEPEGVTVFKNRDYYIQASEGRAFTELVKLEIPEDIVPDSEHIEISVMGNVLGSTVENLDGLVRMPHGCGEQNMVNFVPNILVLRYLEAIKQLNPTIEAKAKNYMQVGYQRELTYKHDDGSYSAFGKSDKAGSTWLTAYVIRSFRQATKYIDIDSKILEEGLNFLASTQATNGSFSEHGKVLDFSHQNEIGLTAFVLLAFLENIEFIDKHKNTIDRGFKYLQEQVKNTEDLYGLSIAVYALQLRKADIAENLLTDLKTKAKSENDYKWWNKVADKPTDTRQWWRPKSHDVEITSYILMSLLERGEPVGPIAKWLIAQRNSNGGFSSTQETVVGLQALIKFAETTGAADVNVVVEYVAVEGTTSAGKFEVNKDSALSLQSAVLDNSVRAVKFDGRGVGSVILQVSYRYNVYDKELKPGFTLKVEPNTKPGQVTMDLGVCTEFVPLEGEDKQSNMVVMEVTLPSGFIAVTESFDKIKEVENIKLVESKNQDTKIILYFDGLIALEKKCISIEAERAHAVADQKPVPVVVYDYYDNDKRATQFYTVKTSACDICTEDDLDCKKTCVKLQN